MPKMTDRERLAKIEADRRKLESEAQEVRANLRAQYGALAADIPVEQLSEREFREILTQAIRIGGFAAIAALKTQSEGLAQSTASPERRSREEHGEAARRRPAPTSGAASPGDGAGQRPAP